MGKVPRGTGLRTIFGESPRREEVVQFFRKELDVDVISIFNRLKSLGAIPADKLTDRMALSREINQAGPNARMANMIWLKAKKERELFRIEFARRMRDLTREAMKSIRDWMEEEGVTKKQITKEMIEQEMASNSEIRERYEALIREQEELREIRDNCQSLAERWSKREGTLQTQASLLRQEREVVFGSPKA